MKNDHTFKQSVRHKQRARAAQGKGGLAWWQLSLVGIGSIVGAGFFLGTGLSIRAAGPSVLLGYVLAGLTAFFVFGSLAEMTANDPQPGSFRTYARQAFGHVAGFASGWMYWLAGILIMSSEIAALSTFTQYWFPGVPLWVFSAIYAAAGIGIILLGVRDFGRIESLFATVKLSTLVIFIGFGTLLLTGVVRPGEASADAPSASSLWSGFFPHGAIGLWSAMIFVFFSFGGIAVVGVTASELRDKNDIPKAGTGLLATLVAVYLLSLFFVLRMANWTEIDDSESPFVTALASFGIPYLDSIMNLVMISAAFSTMVGALFSVSRVMESLAEDGDAPRRLKEKNGRGVSLPSLFLTAAGLAVSIACSYVLPDSIYEYATTAAGVMLILNWTVILASQLKLRKARERDRRAAYRAPGYPGAPYAGIALILLAIAGACFHRNERIGLGVSVGLILVILACYRLSARARRGDRTR